MLEPNDPSSQVKRSFWQSASEDKSSLDKKSGYINCLYFDAVIPSGLKNGDVLIPSADPNKGKVGLQFGDPLFDKEAMKQKIFRFKPGSPCEKLGIKPLDMSKVGSTLVK